MLHPPSGLWAARKLPNYPGTRCRTRSPGSSVRWNSPRNARMLATACRRRSRSSSKIGAADVAAASKARSKTSAGNGQRRERALLRAALARVAWKPVCAGGESTPWSRGFSTRRIPARRVKSPPGPAEFPQTGNSGRARTRSESIERLHVLSTPVHGMEEVVSSALRREPPGAHTSPRRGDPGLSAAQGLGRAKRPVSRGFGAPSARLPDPAGAGGAHRDQANTRPADALRGVASALAALKDEVLS
jgi:hypothetical protein